MKAFLLGALLLATLAAPAPVAAQSETDVDLAEQAYSGAIDAFRSGDNGRAADLFRASYELVPKPELLYNESVARARSGDFVGAQRVADEALTVELHPRVHAKLRGRMVGWDSLRRARDRAVVAPPIENAPPVEPTPGLELRAQTRPTPKRGLRTTSYVLGGFALAAMGTAAVMEWRVSSSARELDEAAAEQDRERYDDMLRRGKTQQAIGRSTLIAGGVLLTTAIVMWVASQITSR